MVAPIKAKMVESSDLVICKETNRSLVRRVDQMGIISSGRGRPIKALNESIKTDLDLNDYSTNLNTIATFNPCNRPHLGGNDFLLLYYFSLYIFHNILQIGHKKLY